MLMTYTEEILFCQVIPKNNGMIKCGTCSQKKSDCFTFLRNKNGGLIDFQPRRTAVCHVVCRRCALLHTSY